jgi:Phage related hypothetical protein (DUF1799)
VARHWATGSDTSQLKSDAEGFGIPVAPEPLDECVVWEENWEAARIFLSASNQWRTDTGCYVGLDYGVLFKLMDLYSVEDSRATFEAIQIIESEALTLLNKSG